MEVAKTEAEAKEEAFDSEVWLKIYDQENPPIEIAEETVEEGDGDLEEEISEAVQ